MECRARKVEPPGRTRVAKVLVAARGRWEKTFCARVIERLGEAGTALLVALKRDPGAVGLDSLLTEITMLNDVRQLGLPEGLFAYCSEKLVAAWRARAIKMYPSDFRDTAEDVRITLLAALCASRQAEITDALVELLVALVHKINDRAERRVEKQLTAELKKVRGKEGILGHGYCTYTFFEQCPHRMACAHCDFYTPKGSSKGQLLEAKDNLQRMLASVPLSDEERAAVDDGQAALDQLLERLVDVPTRAGRTPREIGVPATATLLPIVAVNQGKG